MQSGVLQSKQPAIRFRSSMRWLIALALVAIVLRVGRPVWHVCRVNLFDVADREQIPDGFVDDASAMNLTAVQEVWQIPTDPTLAERQLQELLARARRDGSKVAIAGARHSMGGHTIAPDGIVIDMRPFNAMSLDQDSLLLTVQSGAIWSDVIDYLDQYQLSVTVMQSNDSFTVGGSISVNCHGWQFGHPPIAATVQSFRLMQPNGEIVTCSREENAELFGLVLGGYGLFGIILDAELRVVPNRRYRVARYVVPAIEALETFDREVSAKRDVEMVYARMDVSTDNFLSEVLIYALIHDPAEDGSLPPLEEKEMASLRRQIFRGSVDSDYGKRLRWDAETKMQSMITPTHVSRNQVLCEGVEVFANRSQHSTDILHEYFIPRQAVTGFIKDLQQIIPEHHCDLLNVTVREIETDQDTFLRYADVPMFSLVMMFNQPRTKEADLEMQTLTQAMIDAVLQRGGRYYLPYRLHATQMQFEAAYPRGVQFFEYKRQYDPEELFVNQFYLKYGRSPNVGTQEN